jgi:hypothetical protein
MPDHGITPDMVPTSSAITGDQIDAVVETVRRICGWHIWPVREETVKLDSSGDCLLFLPTKRLVELKSVEVGGKPVGLDAVQWSEDGYLQGHFPEGLRNVTVTMRHGYDSALDLVGVCLQMAKRTAEAHSSYQVGGISVGASNGITPQSTEWRIVDCYKLGPLP